MLWLFASGVLLAVLCYGWFVNNGDVAYGRLEKFPVPEGGVSRIHAIPPLALLILTRFGVPASTTRYSAPANRGADASPAFAGIDPATAVRPTEARPA